MKVVHVDKGLRLTLDASRKYKWRHPYGHVAPKRSYAGKDMTQYIQLYQDLNDLNALIVIGVIVEDYVEATPSKVFVRDASFSNADAVVFGLHRREDDKGITEERIRVY